MSVLSRINSKAVYLSSEACFCVGEYVDGFQTFHKHFKGVKSLGEWLFRDGGALYALDKDGDKAKSYKLVIHKISKAQFDIELEKEKDRGGELFNSGW